jgi:hypothetical protein
LKTQRKALCGWVPGAEPVLGRAFGPTRGVAEPVLGPAKPDPGASLRPGMTDFIVDQTVIFFTQKSCRLQVLVIVIGPL